MSQLNDLLKNDGASIDADDDFEAINALAAGQLINLLNPAVAARLRAG